MIAPESIDYKGVAEEFGLEFILLFGSLATGAPTHSETDVDIAVRPEEGSSPDVMALMGRLMGLLKTHRLDLVVLSGRDYFLEYQITQNCKVLYEARPYAYLDYAWRAVQRYEAHKPLEKLRRELLYEHFLGRPPAD